MALAKTIILEDVNYDRYIFKIYDENKKLVGLNYVQGIGDLDMSYSENNPILFGFYEKAKELYGKKWKSIEVIREAIAMYMRETDELYTDEK